MAGSFPCRILRVWATGLLFLALGHWTALGEEACCSNTNGCLVARIRDACRLAAGRQPYRPFDDHFPRFHPVPVSPVFPSLYDTASAANTSAVRREQPPREAVPGSVPYPIPAKPQEAAPLPSPKTSEGPKPLNPLVPRQALRSMTGTSWIFLPAVHSVPQESSAAQSGNKVAAQAQQVVR